MKIKEIKNAQAIYDEVVKLDGEIIALDKRAISLANEDQSCKLSLWFDKSAEKEPDICGSIRNLGNGYMQFNFSPGCSPLGANGPKNYKDVTNLTLTDIETLYVIDVLIVCKKAKRRELIQELKDLGFTL